MEDTDQKIQELAQEQYTYIIAFCSGINLNPSKMSVVHQQQFWDTIPYGMKLLADQIAGVND